MRQGLITMLIVAVLGLTAWALWPEPQPMPQTRFNLLDGRQIDSATLRGRPVLINFWSVTCAVCLRDLPKLTRLQQSLTDRRLLVIGVAMPHDPPPVVIDLVEKRSPGHAIALDVHGEVNRAFGGVQVTPTTFLIDPAGQIRYTEQGPLDEIRIRAMIATFPG